MMLSRSRSQIHISTIIKICTGTYSGTDRALSCTRRNHMEAITLTAHVMREIHQRIAGRQLITGARLPSIRALAGHMRVSKCTVVEAYDRLAAEGTIFARRGSGFYVSAPRPPLSLIDIGPRLAREIAPLWVARQALETEEALLKPGCGWLPPSWLPQDSMRRALRSLAKADSEVLSSYDTPLGF